MKMRWILAGLVALAGAAHGEVRAFTSADGSKRFEATLLAYREKEELVTVQMKGRTNTVQFKLGVLSEADQAYIKEQAPALRAASALKVAFERYRKKDDSAKVSKYVGGYEIALRNLSPDVITDVEVEYLIIYRKGSLAQGSAIQTERGSQAFPELLSGIDQKIVAGEISMQSAASRDKEACSGST